MGSPEQLQTWAQISGLTVEQVQIYICPFIDSLGVWGSAKFRKQCNVCHRMSQIRWTQDEPTERLVKFVCYLIHECIRQRFWPEAVEKAQRTRTYLDKIREMTEFEVDEYRRSAEHLNHIRVHWTGMARPAYYNIKYHIDKWITDNNNHCTKDFLLDIHDELERIEHRL